MVMCDFWLTSRLDKYQINELLSITRFDFFVVELTVGTHRSHGIRFELI